MTNDVFADIAACFDYVDATPPDFPGCYRFCLPNARAYRRWPGWPAAARPEYGRAASGRGVSQVECRLSGLGEAVELASACAWGDEVTIRATQNDLGPSALSAQALLGHSDAQLACRESWNAGPFGTLDWRPNPQDPHTTVDWVAATWQDGTTVYVPADLVYVGRRQRGDKAALGIATTSGCAAGEHHLDAMRRARLELLERDAIGMWWYGGLPPAQIPLDLLDQEQVLREFLRTRSRITSLFDISTDLCRHVVVAAAWETDGTGVALGFSAHEDVLSASRAAVTELLQTEIGLMQRRRTGDALTALWLRKAHAGMEPFQPDGAPRPVVAPPQMASIDLTRREFGVSVIRVICPDLASDKPRLGHPRFDRKAKGEGLPLLI